MFLLLFPYSSNLMGLIYLCRDKIFSFEWEGENVKYAKEGKLYFTKKKVYDIIIIFKFINFKNHELSI